MTTSGCSIPHRTHGLAPICPTSWQTQPHDTVPGPATLLDNVRVSMVTMTLDVPGVPRRHLSDTTSDLGLEVSPQILKFSGSSCSPKLPASFFFYFRKRRIYNRTWLDDANVRNLSRVTSRSPWSVPINSARRKTPQFCTVNLHRPPTCTWSIPFSHQRYRCAKFRCAKFSRASPVAGTRIQLSSASNFSRSLGALRSFRLLIQNRKDK